MKIKGGLLLEQQPIFQCCLSDTTESGGTALSPKEGDTMIGIVPLVRLRSVVQKNAHIKILARFFFVKIHLLFKHPIY